MPDRENRSVTNSREKQRSEKKEEEEEMLHGAWADTAAWRRPHAGHNFFLKESPLQSRGKEWQGRGCGEEPLCTGCNAWSSIPPVLLGAGEVEETGGVK